MFGGITAAVAKAWLFGHLKRVGGNALHDLGGLASWLGRRTPLEILGLLAMALLAWQHFVTLPRAHKALAACQEASKGLSDQLATANANETLLRSEVTSTNRQVTDLSNKSASEQAAAAKARQNAAQRVASAQAVAGQLLAASRSPAPPAQPCGPSPAKPVHDPVDDQWK